jgi:hypothetical protein
MLQVFHLDIAKLDQDFAYIGKCFKYFHIYVASILSSCLNMFTMATHVFSSFSGVLQLFQTYVISVSPVSNVYCKCFIRMLQKMIGCCTCCNTREKRHVLFQVGLSNSVHLDVVYSVSM